MSVIIIMLVPPAPVEYDGDLVDARYVAARFSCSVRSVQKGACGTGAIMRVSSNPLRFRRADVHAALKRMHDEAQRVKARRYGSGRLLRRKG